MILVTGCAGFIGARVCRLLLDSGQEVIGIDDMNNAYDVRLKEFRLGELQERIGFSWQQGDISEPGAIEKTWHSAPTAVINLAARAGVRQSVENPWVYYTTNVTGTLNMLELCRSEEIPKFVLASTSSLYGANDKTPFREDSPTDRPLSPYAASKKGSEALCYTYHHLYGLDVTVLRYFTVYGPAGRPDMSILRFVKWITEGEPLQVTGDGTQERDFTFVQDIAEGTVAALKPLGFETINLGSDRPVSIKTTIEKLEGLIGRSAKIQYLETHPADVRATWADIAKARSLLGWEPKTTLESGLAQVVDWYNAERSWASTLALGD
jgi:nucleoside-diphosphate-sugar epimerase